MADSEYGDRQTFGGDSPPPHDLDFRRVWTMLARFGQVDAVDGVQYDRVRCEWSEEGRPRPIVPFIMTHRGDTAPG